MAVISADKLVKKYGSFEAVKGISFAVEKGEIFGLLGENGAGKTTTLEIIEGLRRLTDGKVTVLGFDITKDASQIKSRIGVQLQSSAYYSYLKLNEILELFASFYNKKIDAEDLLDMVHLRDKGNSYVTQLSGGQKQRFSIVASLVNDPEIVFLDEPTTGLDPVARRSLWELIRHIKSRGKTIILTTHYLEEAEMLCDRVAIMEKGHVVAIGKTSELIDKAKSPYVIWFECDDLPKKVATELSTIGELNVTDGRTGQVTIHLKKKDDLSKVLQIIGTTKPTALSVRPASLEDIFIELTGSTIAQEVNA